MSASDLQALDVAIIGCGTAGAAAALFLARAGHRVTVYEAVEQPQAIGAGILLQPTGMAVLDRLDLLADVLARGAIVQRLRCVTPKGRAVVDLAYGDVHVDAFGLGLHRGVLFSVLYQAVRDQPGIELRCGHAIETFERDPSGRMVLIERQGRRFGPHQLIVMADGARSQLRAATSLTERATQYPWGALWFIGTDPDNVFQGALFQVVDGTEHMLGLLPSGLGPEGDVPRVSLFWSLKAERLDAWRDAGLAPWKARISSMEPRTASLLQQISRVEDVLFARYWDVVMRRWHAENIVCLGDAAHATSPQLGQGANLALVDAMVLADSLAQASSMDQALVAYSAARRSQLAYYQWATRVLTPFFQSDRAAFGRLRDAFMPIACRIGWTRQKMTRTMCGLERGFLFARSLPMPALPKCLPKHPPLALAG